MTKAWAPDLPGYTFNELHADLKALLLVGSPNLRDGDDAVIGQINGLIYSLTNEERQDPLLLLQSPSRWRRATRGAGGSPISRRALIDWLDSMGKVRAELC